MTPNDRDPASLEDRLDRVLVEYLEAVETGVEPDRRALLVTHPEFYDELTDFFADRDAIESLAGPLREAARDPEEESILAQLDPSEIPDHLGRIGPYEVIDWIGRGGMGVVFKGFDASLNRYVAIKVLAPQWAVDPGARRRFLREARSAASISHPHVVTIHAVGEWKGRPYLVMEYVAGPTLEERLEEDGPPPVAEILAIAIQVASGLAAAHSQGLIHRDVKPSNILLEGDLARAKLVDFGLARAMDDAGLSQQGMLAGTPQYMAPEQARGEPLDSRADLFSLGGVLYALCTGEPAFRGTSIPDILRRVCDETPISPRRVNPEVPHWLVEIIGRLMAKDPARRFDTAAAVADRLERHLATLRDPSLPPVEPDGPLPSVRPLRTRSGMVRVVVTLTAGILAGLAVTILERDRGIRPPTDRRTVAVDVALPERPTPGRPPMTAHPEPGRLRQTFHRDFLEGRRDFRGLKVAVRPGLEAMPEPVARGLRLKVSRGLVEGVGLTTTFRIGGDFEITAGYETLPADPPRIGTGMGPEMKIGLAGVPDVFASVAWLQRKTGSVFALAHATLDPDGRRRILGRWPEAEARSGLFRMVRVGPTLHYLVADGAGAAFRDLFRVEFGSGEVDSVTLGINAGGSWEGVDVLWTELSIRAERLPGLLEGAR